MPSMGTDKMPIRQGRPCAAMAMATRLMAETGMMMPASGSDGSCWSKVAEMQQLRMPPHERQWSTTLLPLSRSRTPPSRSQHIDCCTLEDRVAAGISLLGRGCGALGAERGNKTSERLFRPFCPLLDPPRFRTSQVRVRVLSKVSPDANARAPRRPAGCRGRTHVSGTATTHLHARLLHGRLARARSSTCAAAFVRAPPPLGADQRVHDLEVVDRPALVAGATSRAQAVNFMA